LLTPGAPLVQVVRDGAIDALHAGHVAVVDPTGRVLAAHGDPSVACYPRSALKPFQAAAALALCGTVRPPSDEIAIMTASHTGARVHQAAVTRVLDRAGLTPGVLRCPAALPTDPAMLVQHPPPTRLAHDCSGKHAGFLLAEVAGSGDPTRYLAQDAAVQMAVRAWLRDVCGDEPAGPGVDGCGAPAWRLPLTALARGFAELAAADDGVLAMVAEAMRTHPDLVGGDGVVDTVLMHAERRLVAKRGAEGVMGIAVHGDAGPLGVAIKVSDGATRAVGPVAVAVVERLGLRGAVQLRRPPVLGGGTERGGVEVTSGLTATLAALG
jgi:L-asparaginase II